MIQDELTPTPDTRSSNVADSTKMRVLMLGEVPEPAGGVATWCVEVCTQLVGAGILVDVLDTEHGSEKHPPPGLSSYTVIGARSARNVARLLSSPRILRHLIAIFSRVFTRPGSWRAVLAGGVLAPSAAGTINSGGARLIVAHHAGARGIAALIVGRAAKVPVVLVEHGSRFTHPGRLHAVDAARVVAEGVDRVLVPSEHTLRACERFASPRRIDVVPNGVDHRRFRPSPKPGAVSATELTVLFVGHLHPRKGVDVLVRAIPYVAASRAVRFRLAGRDSGEGRLIRELASRLGIEGKVEFVGQVVADQLPDLYRDADVLVFPTVWETEGFGLVAAEAMACGTPVVASRIGAIPEVVVDSETGLLFSPGDERDLAEKLNRMLNDDALRHRFGVQAAAHAQTFDWANVARAILERPGDGTLPATD